MHKQVEKTSGVVYNIFWMSAALTKVADQHKRKREVSKLMKYKYLLFDADDTLLDFKRSEHEALTEALIKYGIDPTDEVTDTYSEINDGLWRLLERGGIGKNELRIRRFELFAKRFGLNVDPSALAAEYTDRLAEKSFLVDNAEELCRSLYGKYRMFIITNGIKNIQESRLGASPIKEYIEKSFISEEVGYEKPSKKYFDFVAAHIDGFEAEKALIVGDSLTSDIAGGAATGIDTCWFNPRHKKPTGSVLPTYEIHSLGELYGILDEKEEA